MSTTTQLITRVDFVTVPTHDLDAAVEFYGQILRLPCSVYRKDRNFAEFETGNLTLGVIDAEAMGLEHHAQKGIALHVEDIEDARRTLEGRGLAFQGDTFDTGVCHMAFFSDPEGNALMLHARYAPRTEQ
jgi:predicted enzyme related to lactoylglutathione lyase